MLLDLMPPAGPFLGIQSNALPMVVLKEGESSIKFKIRRNKKGRAFRPETFVIKIRREEL